MKKDAKPQMDEQELRRQRELRFGSKETEPSGDIADISGTAIKQKSFSDRIQVKIDEAEKNFFKDEETRRIRIAKRNATMIKMAVLLLLLIIVSLFGVTDFRNNPTFSFASYINGVVRNLQGFYNFLIGGVDTNGMHFVFFRALIAVVVGAALSCCGTVYQGSLRNAIASPATLGVQSGGMLAGFIFIMFVMPIPDSVLTFEEIQEFYNSQNIFTQNMRSCFIIVGSRLSVTLVVSIGLAAGRGKLSTLTLILAGFVFTSLVGSITGLMSYYMLAMNPGDPRIDSIRTVMMGTFNNVFTFEHFMLVAVPIFTCLAIVFFMRIRFNMLIFGEDEARAMGMRVRLFRNSMVAVCTFMVAVTISFCGQIGFIGLIVPHITRLVVGPDFRALIPASMLMGGIITLFAYDVAVGVGYSTNLNVVTSLVGGLIFLVFLIIFRRKRNADWA